MLPVESVARSLLQSRRRTGKPRGGDWAPAARKSKVPAALDRIQGKCLAACLSEPVTRVRGPGLAEEAQGEIANEPTLYT